MRHRPRPDSHDRDRGAATVAMITFMFVFMLGSLLWLSRTVDQSLDDRTNASAVAFQAARSGAQALDPAAARRGEVVIDEPAARRAAASTVSRLLAANGDTGRITAFAVDGSRVTITVTIDTTGRPSSGSASATASRGFDDQDQ
jgi:hypothetical protein